MELLTVLEQGEVATAAQMAQGVDSLQMMVKSIGIHKHLWTNKSATLFLVAGTQSYTIKDTTTPVRAVSTFRETTTSADASNTDLTVDLTSVTGVSTGDVIGIVTSSTAIHWTTVNGAPAASTVTITDALTTDVDSGAVVYVYTASSDLIDKPLKIINLQRRNLSVDTPIDLLSEEEYYELPSKDSQGIIAQVYLDVQRDTVTLNVWPTSQVVTDTLKFRYQRRPEDTDAETDNMDFPQEWLEVLVYQLALRLAPKYGVTPDPMVVQMAISLLSDISVFDNEDVPLYFAPETRYES